MNTPILINLYAGPGSGKSTTAAGVFTLLKLHGVNVELITEFAKDLTWENRKKTMDNQMYIWAKQYHRIWRVKDQVDVIVTDSPLLLSLIYGEGMTDSFKDAVFDSFKEFENINYFIKRIKSYNPNGRFQTEAESKELDSKIMGLLHKYKLNYDLVNGDKDGINTITRRILRDMHKDVRTKLVTYSGAILEE
jgi:ABC-type oligopeptide transport system ATPase subunit